MGGDAPPSLTDVVDNLLVCVSRPDTISQRVRAAAIGFVAHFLQALPLLAYVDALADYLYDEDNVDHDRIRLRPGRVLHGRHTTPHGTPPLVRHVTRLNALRVRHHTFWNSADP